MTTLDYYEILQVHPKADAAAIEAAYARLRDQYDPARLEGAADELVTLARAKRAAVEEAYAALGDPRRRAAYDGRLAEDKARSAQVPVASTQAATLAAEDATDRPSAGNTPALDYRPLPAAGRQERDRRFDDQPKTTALPERARMTPVMAGMVIAAAILLPSLIAGLVLTGGGSTANVPQVAPTLSPLDQFEPAIAQAQRATEEDPENPQVWVALGNLLYDSAQIVREQAPDSTLYQQRLPRWLDAMAAYRRALELDPQNHAVRGDLGASACFYGATAPDPNYVTQGLENTEAAIAADPQNPRILLSHGYCLVSAEPPRTDEAVAGWRRVLEIVPSDSPFAAQAQALIERYGAQ